MATATTSDTPAPRLPAWRRLGLKLKYAKDTAEELTAKTSIYPTANAASSKQALNPSAKRSREEAAPDTPAKRPKSVAGKERDRATKPAVTKPSNEWSANTDSIERPKLPPPTGVFRAPNQAPKRTIFSDEEVSTPKPATTESISSNPVRPASLRKSVSFTPDTKSQDGFSAHKLFKAWAAGKDPAEVAAQSKSSALPEQPSPSKTPKKEKRPKKTKGVLGSTDTPAEPDEEAENSPKETPNYIRYLQQYHTDRSGWKFNKNRQNDLFKNIFNLHRIPVEHDAAVIEYISGLQGQARQRVANQAEEVLKAVWMQQNEGTDPMSLETADARRAAYYAALRSAYESYKAAEPSRDQFSDRELRDILRELQKAKRAEDILQRALNGEIFTQQQPRLATRPGPSVLSSSTIPRATRISETTQTGRGTYETTEKDLVNGNETKRKRNRKARTEVSDDSDSSSSQDDSSSSQDDSSSDESDSPARKRPASMGPGNGEKDAAQKPKTSPANTAKADRANVSQAIKGNLFDTALLDKKFGKAKS